jgi:hypothetical protein
MNAVSVFVLQFGVVETVLTTFADRFKFFRSRRVLLAAIVVLVMYLHNLIFCTEVCINQAVFQSNPPTLIILIPSIKVYPACGHLIDSLSAPPPLQRSCAILIIRAPHRDADAQ